MWRNPTRQQKGTDSWYPQPHGWTSHSLCHVKEARPKGDIRTSPLISYSAKGKNRTKQRICGCQKSMALCKGARENLAGWGNLYILSAVVVTWLYAFWFCFFTDFLKNILRLFFKRSFRFKATLKGRCRDFPYTVCSYTCIASSIINASHQSGTLVTTEPTFSHQNHPKSMLYITVHSQCTFYGFG